MQLSWLRGQQELGESGYHHWQLFAGFRSKASLRVVKSLFGSSCHGELTKSSAAETYVWKELTRVEGTQFELGAKTINHASKTDWEHVWDRATNGDLLAIPANIRVVSYRTLRCIAADHDTAEASVRNAFVFWGATGTGKSRRAWEEAGMDAYTKDPRSKFWCGYQGEKNIVIDEFRGGIDIVHILRWLDRYPCRVEIKGSSRPLNGINFWFTSNISPRQWFPDVDEETFSALLRRMTVTEFVSFNKTN